MPRNPLSAHAPPVVYIPIDDLSVRLLHDFTHGRIPADEVMRTLRGLVVRAKAAKKKNLTQEPAAAATTLRLTRQERSHIADLLRSGGCWDPVVAEIYERLMRLHLED